MMEDDAQHTAHPIETNQDLWTFSIKSRNIFWPRYVESLQSRGPTRFFGKDYDSLTTIDKSNSLVPKREVLICHDMMGNYREDRKFGKSTKWDDYRFYHWSGVNYFCYFSHYYVTIPPATWINAAHKHGVSVLGTFLTENTDGAQRLREVLENYESVDKTVDALVNMCDHFCFEGYLLNIECPVKPEKISNLLYFIRSLTEKIHRKIYRGVVLWYDATDVNGKLDWKNELNGQNQCFYSACDGILINYNWTDKHLENTSNHCNDSPVKVFMGLDIFGRGQPSGFQAVETLSRTVPFNYSVNFFAPGWTFESNGGEFDVDLNGKEATNQLNELFLKRNDKFWSIMWEHMPTVAYNKLPFYTDFCIGSGKSRFSLTESEDKPFFDLSQQSFQPSVPLYDRARYIFDDAVDGGCCLQILQPQKEFRLFTTEFLVEKTLVFGFASKGRSGPPQLDCILKAEGTRTAGVCEIVCSSHLVDKAREGATFIPSVESSCTYKITKFLRELEADVQLPYSLPNGWEVEYFIVSFDQPIIVKDIGVFWRAVTINETENDSLLGAVYFHAGNLAVNGVEEIRVEDVLVE